jgi:uncharacterized protein (DUF1330 family)
MAKGYWIAHVHVRGQDGYQTYTKALPDILKKHGGRYVIRGGEHEVVEGSCHSRNVIIEFPSYEAALACYHSPEYKEAAAHRIANADTDLIVLKGYDGPQPGD